MPIKGGDSPSAEVAESGWHLLLITAWITLEVWEIQRSYLFSVTSTVHTMVMWGRWCHLAKDRKSEHSQDLPRSSDQPGVRAGPRCPALGFCLSSAPMVPFLLYLKRNSTQHAFLWNPKLVKNWHPISYTLSQKKKSKHILELLYTSDMNLKKTKILIWLSLKIITRDWNKNKNRWVAMCSQTCYPWVGPTLVSVLGTEPGALYMLSEPSTT